MSTGRNCLQTVANRLQTAANVANTLKLIAGLATGENSKRVTDYIAPLPETAQAIADIIGRDATLHLAKHLRYDHLITSGSTCRLLYIPKKKKLTDDYWLVKVIGLENSQLMQKEFGGSMISLAKCADTLRGERNSRIVNAYKAGQTIAAIASEFNLSTRVIFDVTQNARNAIKEDAARAQKNLDAPAPRRLGSSSSTPTRGV